MRPLLLCLFLCLPVYAGQSASESAMALMPPKATISIPAEVRADSGEAAIITAMTEAKNPSFIIYPKLTAGKHYYIDTQKKTLLIWKPGRYEVTAVIASGDDVLQSEPCKVWVRGGEPGPGPDPGPDPDPAPIPAKKLGVLITYESEVKLTKEQHSIIYGAKVRNYLESHCDPDTDVAGWKLYRIWDKDTATAGAAKFWQEINAKAQGKPQPYIVITNGKETFEGPLPANVDETLKLLKKYGGE